MKKTLLLFGLLVFSIIKNQAQTVADIEGNVYNTVTIGDRVWMVENLKTTKYCNGDSIPNVTDGIQWSSIVGGAYCNYNNDTNVSNNYGRLYNWYAVNDNRKIAPTGWHVASKDDWEALRTYVGNIQYAGGKIKEAGVAHWFAPNTGATNESGFTALPGGARYGIGSYLFYDLRYLGYWWSSTQYNSSEAYYCYLVYNDAVMSLGGCTNKLLGYSVRCVMDSTSSIKDINYENNLRIYPNPATDIFTIDCLERQKLKMQVYNIIGECVLHIDLISGTNIIDISSLTSGIYVIRLTGTEGTYQQKLINN